MAASISPHCAGSGSMTKNSPAKSLSSPAQAAISAAPSRWRWRRAVPPLWSTRAATALRRTPSRARSKPAGGKALVHIGDVADAVAVQAMADAAVKQFGRIDILVNNAALRREKPFAEMSYAAWREILDVTLDGAFHCVKACLPALRKSARERSSISAA